MTENEFLGKFAGFKIVVQLYENLWASFFCGPEVRLTAS